MPQLLLTPTETTCPNCTLVTIARSKECVHCGFERPTFFNPLEHRLEPIRNPHIRAIS